MRRTEANSERRGLDLGQALIEREQIAPEQQNEILVDRKMSVGTKLRAWLRASLHFATFAGLILIVGCWLVAAFVSSLEREQAIQAMVKQADVTVRLFEEYTVEFVERIDRTLLLLRRIYDDDPAQFD